MKRIITLKTRITLLVGIIIILISISLTGISISSANYYFLKNNMDREIIENENSDYINREKIIESINKENNIENLDVQIKAVEAQKKFSIQSIIVMIGIIIAGISGTYIMVGKALKPLSQLSDTVHNIDDQNLNKRIDVKDSKDEVSSLAKSFNSMLERLEKSFENQKRFSANAAHELKTPLTTIKASLEVLKIDDIPSIEDYKENADIVEESTNRLIKIVDGLLKLTSSELVDFNDEIHLKNLFKEILSELSFRIESKGIKINLDIQENNIHGNKTLLYRAFFNIIENSIKYGKSNGYINISSMLGKDKIIINVKDNGIGISQDDREHIFEPFFRSDKSHSQQIKGSGLGLSIVKTIIDKHDGKLSVNSEINKGTEFKIIFNKKSIISMEDFKLK